MDRFSETSPLAAHREREPFFTHATPCEVCGEPCSETIWIKEYDLQIGIDCGCNSPDEPVCLEGLKLAREARSVSEILEMMKAHVSSCPLCRQETVRKDAGRETAATEKERAA